MEKPAGLNDPFFNAAKLRLRQRNAYSARRRSPQWLLREAVEQDVEREQFG
jgi:predicted transcriptional regulator